MKTNRQLSLNLAEYIRSPRLRTASRRQGSSSVVHALYFAALPDPEPARQATDLAWRLRTRYGLSARPRAAGLLHVTLYKIVETLSLEEETAFWDCAVFAAMQAASTVRRSRFRVEFDRMTSFGSRDEPCLVLRCSQGNNEFSALQRDIAAAVEPTGFASRKRPFVAHMTLLYQGEPIEEMPIDPPIAWTVRDFVLVHSFQGLSRHKYLNYWRLSDETEPAGGWDPAFAGPSSAATASSTL